jgi:hypothetical protein
MGVTRVSITHRIPVLVLVSAPLILFCGVFPQGQALTRDMRAREFREAPRAGDLLRVRTLLEADPQATHSCDERGLAPRHSRLALAADPQSPDLSDVLRRAGEMVARFAQESAVILADESCRQRAFREQARMSMVGPRFGGQVGVVDTVGRRRWKAELALVQLPELSQSGYPWMEIRDVIEVDGTPLPDRQERLEAMIRAEPNWRTKKAREILEDSARFNIGPARRTINSPAIPLLVLHPPNQLRFTFSKTGDEKVEGVATWKVAFLETGRPTLIRAGVHATDLPSIGTFWIDPATGEVLRADLLCGTDSENRLTVIYRRHPTFGLRLPSEMVEKTTAEEGHTWVDGTCVYSNFRRFEVRSRILVP